MEKELVKQAINNLENIARILKTDLFRVSILKNKSVYFLCQANAISIQESEIIISEVPNLWCEIQIKDIQSINIDFGSNYCSINITLNQEVN